MLLILFSISAFSVEKMNEKLFDELVEKTSDKIPYFIMFTKQDCPSCQDAFPVFEDAEYHTYGIAEYYVVDVVENPNLSAKFQLTHLPTFALFFRNSAIPFMGRPQIPGFSNFLIEQISMRMLAVNESWINNGRNQVIFFANRQIPPSIMGAAFGHFYRYDIDFGMRGDDTIVKLFNVSIPQWYFSDGKKNMTVPSIRQIDQLYSQIREFFNVKDTMKKEHKHSDYNEL